MRLYINGKNTRTIRMYTETQLVADTGAEVEISVRHTDGRLLKTRILPSRAILDDSLAGIEFVSAVDLPDLYAETLTVKDVNSPDFGREVK